MQHKQILCYYEAHGTSVVKQVLTNLNSGKWYYIYNYQYCFSKQERLVTRHQSSVSTNCLTAWGMVRELWGLVSPSITPCPKTIYYCSQTLYSNWLGAKKKKKWNLWNQFKNSSASHHQRAGVCLCLWMPSCETNTEMWQQWIHYFTSKAVTHSKVWQPS